MGLPRGLSTLGTGSSSLSRSRRRVGHDIRKGSGGCHMTPFKARNREPGSCRHSATRVDPSAVEVAVPFEANNGSGTPQFLDDEANCSSHWKLVRIRNNDHTAREGGGHSIKGKAYKPTSRLFRDLSFFFASGVACLALRRDSSRLIRALLLLSTRHLPLVNNQFSHVNTYGLVAQGVT